MAKGDLPTSPEFKAACEAVTNFKKLPNYEDLLTFYSLFKVATREKLDPKPSIFDPKKGYKWGAWAKLVKKGVTSEQAQKGYIEFYEQKKGEYGDEQKKDECTSEQKKDECTSEQKKDECTSEQKKDEYAVE